MYVGELTNMCWLSQNVMIINQKYYNGSRNLKEAAKNAAFKGKPYYLQMNKFEYLKSKIVKRIGIVDDVLIIQV